MKFGSRSGEVSGSKILRGPAAREDVGARALCGFLGGAPAHGFALGGGSEVLVEGEGSTDKGGGAVEVGSEHAEDRGTLLEGDCVEESLDLG